MAKLPKDFTNRRCVAIDPCYGANAFDCGATTMFSKVTWYNSPRKGCFSWEHEAAFYDRDGSFSGKQGNYVIAKSDTFNSNLCKQDESGEWDIASVEPNSVLKSHPAMICQETNTVWVFNLSKFKTN